MTRSEFEQIAAQLRQKVLKQRPRMTQEEFKEEAQRLRPRLKSYVNGEMKYLKGNAGTLARSLKGMKPKK